MKLLCIDTTTEACSCALLDGERVSSDYALMPREHARKILTMIENLLQKAGLQLADIDALAFTRGPGSFTGLRIGASVIQGLALSVDKPVIPLSSLAVLAYRAYRLHAASHVLSAIDARMHELYFAAYSFNDDGMQALTAEVLLAPDKLNDYIANLIAQQNEWRTVGTAWSHYAELLHPVSSQAHISQSDILYPHAEDMIALAQRAYRAGEYVAAAEAVPIYLRNKVTQ